MSLTEIGRKRKGPLTPKEKIGQSSKKAMSGADIFQYPADAGIHQFCMNFVDYNFDNNKGDETVNLSVALPMPNAGIQDAAGMEYNQTDLGLLGAGASTGADALLSAFSSERTMAEGKSGTESSGDIDYGKIAKDVLTGGAAVIRATAGISNEIQGGLDQAVGNTLNPHVALLFNAMKLKTFTLNWKLAPASLGEQNTLRDMILHMQKAIHPAFQGESGEGTNFFLKYPNQVDCYYLGSGNYLHPFKRAAVTGFTVNYQPEGGNVFNAGGAPAFFELSMTIQEVEIWTSEDYEGLL